MYLFLLCACVYVCVLLQLKFCLQSMRKNKQVCVCVCARVTASELCTFNFFLSLIGCPSPCFVACFFPTWLSERL